MQKISLDSLKTKINEITTNVKEEITSFNPVEKVKNVSIENLKEKPFDGMIDAAIFMAGKMPFAGSIATRVFEDAQLPKRAKDFSNTFFNPFYAYKKVINFKATN